MMNNKIKISIAFLFGLLLLAACGNQAEEDNNAAQVEEDLATNMNTTIIGGRTGGAWSVFTEGIAESVRRENDGAYVTVEPGSIIENPMIVDAGKVPYGLSYAMTAYAAYRGEEPFDEKYENIRAVSVVIPANYYQFFTRGDISFASIDEMIENQFPLRLSVDQQGSIGELITREILAHYGVNYEDLTAWGGSIDHLSGSKAFEMMADERLDATGDAESAPSSNILEAAATTELNMLSLEQETIQAVTKALGVEANTIPAGTYQFQDEDVHTVSTPAILIVNKDVPEEEVFAVTKAIYENLDYLDMVHEEFKDLTEEKMMQVGEIPLHPGAERFFKEAGILE